ncbi:MAG: hypothetical protein IAE86_06480 [Burkholderiaceae bacterium]|nr:hypothetical protein [Burkholderiaceae bacterium]
MANKRITELDEAGSLPEGTQFVVSTLSPTVKRTAATLSFAAGDQSINDSANGFVAAGFVAGDQVKVTGAAAGANNPFSAALTSVAAGKIKLSGAALVTAAAGPSVTVTRWDSKRVDLDVLVDELGGGSTYDLAADVHGAASKGTPTGADELALVDSADGNALKKLTWSNLEATLKDYFDTLYSGGGGGGGGMTRGAALDLANVPTFL